MRIRQAWLLVCFAAVLVSISCSENSDVTAESASSAPAAGHAPTTVTVGTSGTAAAATAATQPAAPRTERHEPPLPAFEGWSLTEERISISEFIGRRMVVFLFNPEHPVAPGVANGIAAVAGERAGHNFQIVGIAQGSNRATAAAFLADRGLEIPTIHDANGQFGARVGVRVPVGLLMVDAEGYLIQGTGAPEGSDDPAGAIESLLRGWLRLPDAGNTLGATIGERPRAPDFQAQRIDGGDPFELSSLRGQPAILIFFLHTCPHCHEALRFLRENLEKLPEQKRPALVGVSVLNRTLSVQQRLKDEKLDFFPVLLDPDGSIQEAYGAVGSVPIIFLLDQESRIIARVDGWRSERDPPLMRMRLARMAGQTVPMLLHKTGYSGNEFCGACHERQAATWDLTQHAGAFDTLVRHGADRKGECVSCHVVGFGQGGGYDPARPEPSLEDVGCETCHGRGGPHLSPEFAGKQDYRDVCTTCHNPTHSLGFDYASFLPHVSHAANASLASLPPEERARLLAARGGPREELLGSHAEYAGSQACQGCHAAEHATWSQHPHAAALKTLEAQERSADPECLQCHTTAFGKPGGFPSDGHQAHDPSLASVGCESCHGPGSEHVKPDSKKIGSILSLGDKCDSCVILQICGSCHDDANDPGFEFEVLEKIDLQRHGTTEAGTGKPLDSQAGLPSSTVVGALEQAFDQTVEPWTVP